MHNPSNAPILSRSAQARPGIPAQARPQILHYRRFHGYDYSRGAAMMITFALKPRKPIFGRVKTDHVEYSPAGEVALDVIARECIRDPKVRLMRSVVMPDHIHLRLWLSPGHPEPLKAIGRFVYNVKAWTRNRCKRDLGLELGWEENYHDHILLSREVIETADLYIDNNARKWALMHGNPPPLRVIEPLSATVLPMGEWWTGVGRDDWLAEGGAKLASVRLSRRIPPNLHESVAARLLSACEKGYILAGTWISPCERFVFKRLVGLGHPIVRVSPKPLVSVYRPVREEPLLFSAEKYLLLSRVAGPGTAAGVVWHGLNDALGQIAQATGGTALYVQPDAVGGLHWDFNPGGPANPGGLAPPYSEGHAQPLPHPHPE